MNAFVVVAVVFKGVVFKGGVYRGCGAGPTRAPLGLGVPTPRSLATLLWGGSQGLGQMTPAVSPDHSNHHPQQ